MSKSTLLALLIIGIGGYGAYKYSHDKKGVGHPTHRQTTPSQPAADQKARDDHAEERARGIGGY